jgi:hypothetical protein
MPEKTIPMFVMQQPATFKWPVKVPVPVDGKYEYAEFTATFPNMDEAAIDKLLAKDPQGRPTRSDAEVAADVLLSFEDVATPEGSALPFSEENKAALLRGQRVAPAVAGTFLAAVRGMAAEKNS